MRISDVLRRKGDVVITVRPDETIRDVVATLAKHRIGALVVSASTGTVDGIVSERDVVRQLSQTGSTMLDEPVSSIMTTVLTTCGPTDDVEHLMRLMTERRVRHIPVLVDGSLRGIVSIGDVVKHRIDELKLERDQLVDYLHQ
ncbi:MAG: CBS domain-containing protein [Actinomycetota bacterium]